MNREIKPRRSCLSVPASNARMQAKAATLQADQVVLDLEDATAPSEKIAGTRNSRRRGNGSRASSAAMSASVR